MTCLPPFLQSCEAATMAACDIREGGTSDAIDGIVPGYVAEPPAPEPLALLLAGASRAGASVVVCGGGTKLGWGRQPKPVDLAIGTRRLNRVLAHAHGDLTATVEAGATVRDLNRELARHRQWLPVDVAFDDATVGGLIATNESGPLRHRHGTPRDLLIGVHLAMTDGRVVKAGGTVVKNVAGYDLGRLVSGSHGSLAAIVSATFKLAPLPVATTTVVAGFRDPEALAQAVMTLSASQIEPAAFDVSAVFEPAPAARADAALSSHPSWRSSYRLLLQLATTQEAIDAQVAELRRTIAAETLDLLGDAAEADVWRRQTRSPWAAGGTVIRTSWLPARLQGVLALLGDVARAGGGTIQLAGRAGVGAGLIRFDASASAASAAIARLRSRADLVGHVVVLRAERSVKQQIDVWGAPGDHVALLDAVKRAFDPAGVLNAGRGPI